MQQVSRNRVASQGVVPRLAGRPCEPRHRTKLRVNCSSARADGAQTEAAPEVWSHLSSGQQQLTSTSTSCSRPCSGQQQGSHSSRQWVLPVVAMHQLCMSLHMPAHAAESVSPAAVEVFREFLVSTESRLRVWPVAGSSVLVHPYGPGMLHMCGMCLVAAAEPHGQIVAWQSLAGCDNARTCLCTCVQNDSVLSDHATTRMCARGSAAMSLTWPD